MKTAIDWVEDTKAASKVVPVSTGRTQMQIVVGAEDSWLAPFLVPVDVYICPSEAMVTVQKGATR